MIRQPPGSLERVDAGLRAGDADAARRDALPRRRRAAAWRSAPAPGRGRRSPGANPRKNTRYSVPAWSSTTSLRSQVVEGRDLVEVGAVVAAVADRDLDERAGASGAADAPARLRRAVRATIAPSLVGIDGDRVERDEDAGVGRDRPPEPRVGRSQPLDRRREIVSPRVQPGIDPIAERHEQRAVAQRRDRGRRLRGHDPSAAIVTPASAERRPDRLGELGGARACRRGCRSCRRGPRRPGRRGS